MARTHQYVKVTFKRFKAFESFVLTLRHFNILVGPNNAGKSTILAAFRILAAALRRAYTRKPELIKGPNGQTFGYLVDLRSISVAEENIFYNYDDSEPATVTFSLSNKNELILYFPERDSCYLIADAHGKSIGGPSAFKAEFACSIGFVPILGPVEQVEELYEKEAARLALFNYRAARNFRNIWYHYPEKFEQFRSALSLSWPGMDVNKPEINIGTPRGKPRLVMFCPEERIPREIFWAGFGFQVWCQMLTHLIQSSEASLFMIDEPDIYLHSELQRQLLGLLRNLGPDILLATHSTEIISEAETDDIVLINKKRNVARRIKNPSQLEEVFSILGSNLNPILTQLAKTRRVLFVEGHDFQVLARFASKLKLNTVANRARFAVVPLEGFNPDRMRSLKAGMETTLGGKVLAAVVLDRDYRSNNERKKVQQSCEEFCRLTRILERKEIENFLLVPSAIDRAAQRRIADHANRTGHVVTYQNDAEAILQQFASDRKTYVMSQFLSFGRGFERRNGSGRDEASINEEILADFEVGWGNTDARLKMLPGKEALGQLNEQLQRRYGVNLTTTAIIDAMKDEEVPSEVRLLIYALDEFGQAPIT